jgi:predicted nucleic acid-binding protein
MRIALCDASVAVKWFHDAPGAELMPARLLVTAAQDGRVRLRALDLTMYEVGNVLTTKLGVSGAVAATVLEDLATICGPGLSLSAQVRSRAAEIAHAEGLSFYDAAYVSTARDGLLDLVTADRKMIAADGTLPSSFLAELEGRP